MCVEITIYRGSWRFNEGKAKVIVKGVCGQSLEAIVMNMFAMNEKENDTELRPLHIVYTGVSL